jgi:hypothetical protein
MSIKKYTLVKVLVGMFCILLVLNCTKDDDEFDMDFKFPLKVGNSWNYDYYVTINYDSMAEANGCNDSIYYYKQNLDIISYEKITHDSIPVYNFYSSDEKSDECFTNSYYNNSGDSLICYGYYHAGTGLDPKETNKKLNFIFAGRKFDNPKDILSWIEEGLPNQVYSKEDSIYYDPVTVFKYPFELCNEWVYRQYYPFRMTKKVSGREYIDTEAGSFNCWKVEYVYYDSLFENVSYYDHISEIGMVKRTWDELAATAIDEFNNILGTFTFKGERILTDYTVK